MAVTLTPFTETLCIVACDACDSSVMVSIDPDTTPAENVVLQFAAAHDASCDTPMFAMRDAMRPSIPRPRTATP